MHKRTVRSEDRSTGKPGDETCNAERRVIDRLREGDVSNDNFLPLVSKQAASNLDTINFSEVHIGVEEMLCKWQGCKGVSE